MHRALLPAALLAFVAATANADAPAKPQAAAQTLFWSEQQKIDGFPHMERLFPTHVVRRGAHVHPLPLGKALTLSSAQSQALLDYMTQQKTAGLLVIQDGRIRLERYGLGYGPSGRWTSFSVAKSFTSTLVGAAVRDGYIKSIDDPIVRYIPALRASAYDGVSIRQVLTMTSGVKWNEDYTDPKSDVARLFSIAPDPGLDATVSYMRKLPREAKPGTKWVYKTGETDLIGVLVTAATHKTLADYLSEKVWRPYGMEQDAAWMIDERGQEAGGCCLSVALHDYGRMGMFLLGGGVAQGKPVLPAGWLEAATHKQADIGAPHMGYGYQWWTEDDGSYDALGIFGQAIHIDPKRKLVIVLSSAWPEATAPARMGARGALFAAVTRAVDADPQS
jgi:CubicO group peptidase (beta-lactamase class C family)